MSLHTHRVRNTLTHTFMYVCFVCKCTSERIAGFSHDSMVFPMVSAATIYLYTFAGVNGIDLYYRSESFIGNSCGEIMFWIID